MCKWGTTTKVRLEIPADLSHTGQARWKDVAIDSCIANLVGALQAGGTMMRSSCCGHGKTVGRIDLRDGRVLVVITPAKAERRFSNWSMRDTDWLRRSQDA